MFLLPSKPVSFKIETFPFLCLSTIVQQSRREGGGAFDVCTVLKGTLHYVCNTLAYFELGRILYLLVMFSLVITLTF